MTIEKGSKDAGPGRAGPAAPDPVGAVIFRLDPASGVPTYLQLVQQTEQAIRLGHLRQGDQLPTVKDVVTSLAINPNTVLKAYRELEHRGLAVGRPGQGTFIDGTLHRVGIAEQAALRKTLLAWLHSAGEAGLDEAGMAALFTASLRDFADRHGARGPGHGGSPGSGTGAVVA